MEQQSKKPLGEKIEQSSWGMLPWAGLSALIFILDQLTKQFASAELALYGSVEVLPFFNFTLAHNYGAAFSFLAGAGGWQRWFFTIIAVLVSVILVVWLKRMKKNEIWIAIAVALILGGALGNVYDRIMLGYVVDFLHFYWQDWHFPAFNLADSFIFVGAFMMIVDTFRQPETKDSENVSK